MSNVSVHKCQSTDELRRETGYKRNQVYKRERLYCAVIGMHLDTEYGGSEVSGACRKDVGQSGESYRLEDVPYTLDRWCA